MALEYGKTLKSINDTLLAELDRLSAIDVCEDSASQLQMEIARSKSIEDTARVAIECVAAAVATERAVASSRGDGVAGLIGAGGNG